MAKVSSIYFSSQFLLFLLCGGTALVINFLSRIALSFFIPYVAAILVAYGIGMLTAFLLSKRFVFPRSGNSMRREVMLFVVVNLAWLPIIWLASIWLGEHVFAHILRPAYAEALGHGVAITLPTLINFAFHKFLTFRERPVDQ
jgi:putative flippase GtrA